MSKHQAAEIRNVVLLGHGDSGKTSLGDAMLFHAGAVTRRGSVRDKTSAFDHDDLSKEKGHTTDASINTCEWSGTQINIIDTPGYPDYVGEAIAGLAAAESAIVCIHAGAGVQVNTRKVYKIAEKMGRARAIVITKCDLPDISLDRLMSQIESWFGPKCIPVTLPDRFGPGMTSIIRILRDRGKGSEQAEAWCQRFIEAAVEVDEEAMTTYLDGKEVSEPMLRHCFVEAVRQSRLVPVIFSSIEKDLGIEECLHMIADMLPGADRAMGRKIRDKVGEGEGRRPDIGETHPFLGQVFKIAIDKHVGKVGFVRVLAGKIAMGDHFHNATQDRKEKVGHIAIPIGKDFKNADTASAGDIVAFTKIESLHVGDTLCAADMTVHLDAIPFPTPMSQLAVRPKSRNDETKISEALHKLSLEYPTFHFHRDAVTHEGVAAGISALHLDTVFRRLKDRYHIEVETAPARVAYRECITTSAEGHYRHKKQSGGRGQFGEVYLRVAPGEPGKGLQFDWDIVGGSIPSNFAPAIEKGIREKMQKGVIAGYPMYDVKVSVYDGKFHDVDSSEAAFKIAGGRAFAEAVQKARPALLEPITEAEITVPSESMGDVSGDLNTRRGRIHGLEAVGDHQVIAAKVPLASMLDYARVLTSITSGEGSFGYHLSDYEQVPGNIQAEIVAAFKPHEEEE